LITELDVNLDCALDGRRVLINGSDRRISIEVPDVATAAKLLITAKSAFSASRTRSCALRQLKDQGVQFELLSAKRTLAAFGVRRSLMGELFGLPNSFISFRLIASVVVRSLKRRLARLFPFFRTLERRIDIGKSGFLATES
jgi:hypothetical protein